MSTEAARVGAAVGDLFKQTVDGVSAKREKEKYSILDVLEGQRKAAADYAKAITQLETNQLKRDKQAAEYYLAGKKIRQGYAKIAAGNIKARLDALVKIEVADQKRRSTYETKTRVADETLLAGIDRTINNTKGDLVIAGFGAWQDPAKIVGVDKPPEINIDAPNWETTFRSMLDRMNRKNKAPIFVFDRDEIIDIDQTNSRLAKRNIGKTERGEIIRLMEQYNGKRVTTLGIEQTMDADSKKLKRLLADGFDALEKNDQKLAGVITEQASETLDGMNLTFTAMRGINEREAKEALDLHKFRKDVAEESKAVVEAYKKLSPAEKEREDAGMAMGIASPVFRAWAADHGFDAIGSVKIGEDGMPIVSTYREGGDDIAALRAYKKQQMRKPGNYGFKAIDSGEIWRVELTDGSTVTGTRLRRHAADPFGAIRIVTKDGARVIRPDESTRAQILRKPAIKLSINDRRAIRMYNREKGLYDRLETEALFRAGVPDEEDLAVSEAGFLMKDGKYVRYDDAQAARAAARRDVVYSLNIDGDLYYVSEENGKVYGEDKAGNLAVMDPETSKRVIAALPGPADRDFGVMLAAEGSDRPSVMLDGKAYTTASAADLDAAVGMGIDDTPFYDSTAEERADFYGMIPQLGSNKMLGYTETAEPPPRTVPGTYSSVGDFNVLDTPDDEGLDIPDEETTQSGLAKAQMENLLELDTPAGDTGAPGAAVGSGDAEAIARRQGGAPEPEATAEAKAQAEPVETPKPEPAAAPEPASTPTPPPTPVVTGDTQDRRPLAGRKPGTAMAGLADAGSMTRQTPMGTVATTTPPDSLDVETGDIAFPNLAGVGKSIASLFKPKDVDRLVNRRKKKKKNQGDSVNDDATVATGEVPGERGPALMRGVDTTELYKNLRGDEQGEQP